MFNVEELHQKAARKEVNLNFRVDPITGERLAKYCKKNDLHQSALLREVLKQFFAYVDTEK